MTRMVFPGCHECELSYSRVLAGKLSVRSGGICTLAMTPECQLVLLLEPINYIAQERFQLARTGQGEMP